jgi:hypothetical protein
MLEYESSGQLFEFFVMPKNNKTIGVIVLAKPW